MDTTKDNKIYIPTYICPYMRYTCIKTKTKTNTWSCKYQEEAKELNELLNFCKDKTIQDIEPDCPNNIKRNKDGSRICYILKEKEEAKCEGN